jgi:DNA-binding transcriptional MerR regulator
MPIRTVPSNLPRTPELPETIDVAEVAARLGIHPTTCRKWTKADMIDGGRRVPGGRCLDTKYVVLRSVFERAMRHGIEPETAAQVMTPDVIELAARLRQRAAEDLELADRLNELAVKAHRQSRMVSGVSR